jgi:hypothetical protein
LAGVREREKEFIDFVFVFRSKPVYQTATRAWRKALEKVSIADFRWHDLRHTWASWHVQRGTPLHVLNELGGGRWKWCGMPIYQPIIWRNGYSLSVMMGVILLMTAAI